MEFFYALMVGVLTSFAGGIIFSMLNEKPHSLSFINGGMIGFLAGAPAIGLVGLSFFLIFR